MDESGNDQRPINADPKRGGRPWTESEVVRVPLDGARACADRVRFAAEDVGWLMRKRIAWPAVKLYDALGTRGMIGVFGGGGVAVAGVVAAVVIASSGSGSQAGTTEAFVTPSRPTPTTVVAPTPKPQKKVTKPKAPTLHGAPPSFSQAKKVRSGVSDGKALGGTPDASSSSAAAPVAREAPVTSAPTAAAGEVPAARGSSTGAGETPASTARIGATPEASAAATSQAGILAKEQEAGTAETSGEGAEADGLVTPPAPKAAKQVARHFAEAFVVYETGGVDSQVRETFGATSTKQLSKSLLKRPPRQPASIKVPRAKVVNVVAGPSAGKVYSVSVSLLRVGVTSELRLQMEQGVGKKWQVTDVLG